MPHGLRRWITVVAVASGSAAAAALLAGCQPAPTLRITVNTTVDGHDAHPGDGICEMTPGKGDCSLRAAIDEANASSLPADITVLPGVYPLTLPGTDDSNAGGDLDLRATSISLHAALPGAHILATGADGGIDVRSGTVLLSDISTTGASGAGISVRSGATLAASGLTSQGNGGAGLRVESGGHATAVDATLGGNTGAGASVDGNLSMTYTTVTANHAGGLTGSGSVNLAATVISSQASGADCAAGVSVTSAGYDEDGDGSCHLTATGDKSATPAAFAPVTSATLPTYPLAVGSAAVDVIPVGGPNCPATGATADELGRPRGTNPCDLGAVEGAQTTFTVNEMGDFADAHPGDGICADASGHCSLRAAITEADAKPANSAVTVVLTTNPILTRSGTDDTNHGGDLDSTGADVTILGNGHTLTSNAIDRLVDVLAGRLTISNLNMDAHLATGSDGQAVRVADGAALEVDGGTLQGQAVGEEPSTIWSDGGSTVSLDGVTFPASGEGVATSLSGTASLVGIHADDQIGSFGSTTITGSTLTDSLSVISGTTTVQASTIDAGSAQWAAEVENATLTVTGSTLSGGEGINGGFSGVDEFDAANVMLTDSTVIGTQSDAIELVVGQLAVTDSTIDGASNGVVVEDVSGPVTLTASTVWAPQHAVVGTPATISGSVLEAPGGTTCTAALTSGGYNAAPDTTCGLTLATDQGGNNPLVGPLAANGGPTLTRLPYSNSPLLDAIPTGTTGLCVAGTTDQRGVPRPQGSGCDIGAVEGHGNVSRSFHESLTVNVATDTHDVNPGDGVCADTTGHCSLRAAIDETNVWPGPDTITINPGIDPTLTQAGAGESANASGDLDVRDSLTVHGNGATIDAAGLDRVVHHWGGSLALDDLTLQDGQAGSGVANGLASEAGTLTLEQVTLTRSSSSGPFQTSSLSIASTATISDSTISRNGSLAAIEVRAGGHLTLRQSTVSENGGAGLDVDTGGSLALHSSTVADNSGGVLGSAGTVSLAGNILSGGSPACAASTGITSLGYNVVTDSSCQTTQATDHVVANALLSPLAAQGGPTETQVPYQGSPALDRIPVGTAGLCDATTPTDQRGVSRPQGPACDAGATEGNAGPAQAPTPLSLTVNTSADTRDADPGDGVCADSGGQCSLRAAIDEANAWPTADTITIGPGINPTLTRAGNNEDYNANGDLDVRGDLTIHGGGATVNAAGLDRVIDDESGSLALDHLTITGGVSPSYPLGGVGGGILAADNLTLDHVTVSGNTAGGGGPGGGVATVANLAMTSSTVTGNQTQTSPVSDGDAGSGIYSGGTATISGSRIYNNTGPATDGASVGLYAAGSLTLTTSRVDHNPRGGVLTTQLNGAANDTITDSTIDDDGPIGVEISAPTTIVDSTITANTIGVEVGLTTTITSSTIVGNTGSALDWDLSFPVTLTASLLSTPSPAPVCTVGQADVTITITSGGYNRATDTSCGLTGPTDQQGVVLSLGALGPNGGSTPTIVPNSGSPGVDAIPMGTAGLCDGTEPADQRGVSRPQGPACDVGSVER